MGSNYYDLDPIELSKSRHYCPWDPRYMVFSTVSSQSGIKEGDDDDRGGPVRYTYFAPFLFLTVTSASRLMIAISGIEACLMIYGAMIIYIRH